MPFHKIDTKLYSLEGLKKTYLDLIEQKSKLIEIITRLEKEGRFTAFSTLGYYKAELETKIFLLSKIKEILKR